MTLSAERLRELRYVVDSRYMLTNQECIDLTALIDAQLAAERDKQFHPRLLEYALAFTTGETTGRSHAGDDAALDETCDALEGMAMLYEQGDQDAIEDVAIDYLRDAVKRLRASQPSPQPAGVPKCDCPVGPQGQLMDIWSEPGTKVVFAYPNNGRSGDQEVAKAAGLVVGCCYTISRTSVGSSYTTVWLEESHGYGFNSVHFAPADAAAAQGGEIEDLIRTYGNASWCEGRGQKNDAGSADELEARLIAAVRALSLTPQLREAMRADLEWLRNLRATIESACQVFDGWKNADPQCWTDYDARVRSGLSAHLTKIDSALEAAAGGEKP
jgi:hypothetical protein